jgi:hypothetical protein
VTEGTSIAPLETVISQVNQIPTPGDSIQIPSLDLAHMVSAVNNLQFFNYQGSLTTPPCTEGLTFLLGSQALPLQPHMFNALKAVVGSNNRHIQGPLGEENVIITGANSLAALQQGQQQVVNQCQNQISQPPVLSSTPASTPAAIQTQSNIPPQNPAPAGVQNLPNQQGQAAVNPAAVQNQANQPAAQNEQNQPAQGAANPANAQNQANQNGGQNQQKQQAQGEAAPANAQDQPNQPADVAAAPKAGQNQANQPANGAANPAAPKGNADNKQAAQNEQNKPAQGGSAAKAQNQANQPAKAATAPQNAQNQANQPAGDSAQAPKPARSVLKYFFA